MDESIKESELEEQIRQAKRDYQNEWRRNHPEAVKEYNRKYWMKRVQANKGE